MTEKDILTQTNGFSSLNYLDNGKTRVSGFMIHEGTYNDITFEKEELDKCVNTFVGKPMLTDHTNSVNNVIGEIVSTHAQVDPDSGLYGLTYDSDIDSAEEDLIRKMKLGFIKSTSIGIQSTKRCSICGKEIFECNHWFWDEGFKILATDIKGLELSVVAVPADQNASIGLAFGEDNFLEELDTLKKERRTNMSDKFEEKYAQVMDEFSQYKVDKADEISKLKEEYEAKKDDLEVKLAQKVDEIGNLKDEISELKNKNESLSDEVKEFKETFARKEEERLANLRAEVSDLNKKVGEQLSQEEIDELGEKGLEQFHRVFTNQLDNSNFIDEKNDFDQKYEDDSGIDEDASSVDQFMQRLGY